MDTSDLTIILLFREIVKICYEIGQIVANRYIVPYFIDEGKALLVDELGKDYGNYFSVLAALAGGNSYRSDMTGYVGFETGGYLDKLEKDFDLVA